MTPGGKYQSKGKDVPGSIKCEPGCQCKVHTSKIGYRPSAAAMEAAHRKCEPDCTCGRHTVSPERREAIKARLTGTQLSSSHRAAVAVGATKHGQSGKGRNDQTGAYKSWEGMKQRCLNPNSPRYANYGGRGIAVCNRWLVFENFYADMGDRPAGASLDRRDNNGNYEPGNCRWATAAEQARNRRNNGLLSLAGVTKCLTDWALELGVSDHMLRTRLRRGWSDERTLTTPARTYRKVI